MFTGVDWDICNGDDSWCKWLVMIMVIIDMVEVVGVVVIDTMMGAVVMLELAKISIDDVGIGG